MSARTRLGRLRRDLAERRFRRGYDWEAAPAGRERLVLIYNHPWGRPAPVPAGPLPGGFEVTDDRSRYRDAAAVVFHLPSLGSLEGLRRYEGQLWVGQTMECDEEPAGSRFDLRMGYRRDWEVPLLYCRPGDVERMRAPARGKDLGGVALFASSRHDRSGRYAYAEELMSHLEVHSYGRRLRNRRLRPDRGVSTKLETIARHRFTLAFENARATDYVTEKFFHPLIAGSVPVCLGAPNVEDFAPGDRCYIDTADFDSPAHLAEHLTALAADERAYAEYQRWREEPLRPAFLDLVEAQREHPLVRLCRELARAQPVPHLHSTYGK